MGFYEAMTRRYARHNFSALAEWAVHGMCHSRSKPRDPEVRNRGLKFRNLDGIAGWLAGGQDDRLRNVRRLTE